MMQVVRLLIAVTVVIGIGLSGQAEKSKPATQAFPKLGIMPKAEIGALRLLKKNPEHDGRGTVVAVFDTGVDPGAPGLRTTSDGRPKIIDIVDATGSGDVLMSTPVKPKDGVLEGLTGRKLKIDPKWTNPKGEYRLGIKSAYDLFPGSLISRMKKERKKTFDRAQRKLVAKLRNQLARLKAPSAKQRKQKTELQNRLDQLLAAKSAPDPGPVFDCVVFHDGKTFRAVVDTDEDGNLADETPLTNYRAEPKFATFKHNTLLNFSVNIYENGKRLSVVTASGAHGTHVAGIIAANYPDRPSFNGVAPGAQIVSVKIGDSRLGGMETAAGLVRGLRTVIENRCDLINMSFGEASNIPNHGRLISLFTEVVRKHGVIFVASAGNEGPALSTVGSPGGTSSAVIGVGAYVSPEMMAVEYTLRKTLPGMPYSWSSRGPTFDGDLGVDIFAPGGAISPVPTWTLQKNMRMNGTSMSSPNCCGGIALILSALKAQKVPYSPASVRRAMSNTAKRILAADVFAQGPGLLQVDAATSYLVKNQKCLGERLRFPVSVSGTGGKRGIYLREAFHTSKPSVHGVTVKPAFHENVKGGPKSKFEMRIALKTDAEWIHIGPHFVLTNGGSRFNIGVNPTELAPGVHFGWVLGIDADNPDRGPIFRVPVTLCRSTPLENGHHSELLKSVAGQVHRRFFIVPEGVEWAELKLRASTPDEQTRRFIIHTLKTRTGESIDHVAERNYVTLAHNRKRVHSFPVQAGQSIEVCLAQYWSSIGAAEVGMELRFRGLHPNRRTLALSPGTPRVRLEVTASSDHEELAPKAALKTHRTFYRPKSATVGPLDAHRDRLPDGSPIYQLLLSYAFEQTKAGSVTPRFPDIDGMLYDSPLGTHLWMLFDAANRRVTTDDIWPSAVKLPKGKYTLKLQLRHPDVKTLEKHKTLLMAVDRPLAKSISLGLFASNVAAADGTPALKSRKLHKGERVAITVVAPKTSQVPATAVDGDILLGSIQYGKADTTTDGPGQRPQGYTVRYSVAGTGRARTAKSTSASTIKGATLAERMQNLKLAEIDRLTAAGKTSKTFDGLVDEFSKSKSHATRVLTARLKLLDHEKFRKERLGEVVKAADAILSRIDTDKLALHFGRRVDSDDPKAVKLRKTMETRRALLIDTLYRKGRALGYMELPEVLAKHPIADAKAHDKLFVSNFAGLRKWVDTTDKKYVLLHVRHERRQGRFGTALKLLKKYGDRSSTNFWFHKKHHDIYEKLGWKHLAEYESRWLIRRFPKELPAF